MLCFGGKSCFLIEKLKVGNRDQTKLNIGGQSVNFKSWVDKVKMGQITSGFTLISPIYFDNI